MGVAGLGGGGNPGRPIPRWTGRRNDRRRARAQTQDETSQEILTRGERSRGVAARRLQEGQPMLADPVQRANGLHMDDPRGLDRSRRQASTGRHLGGLAERQVSQAL